MSRVSIAAVVGAALVAALSATAGSLPAPGNDELPCAPHAEITASLGQIHAEQPVSRGIDVRGVMLEVFAAPEGNWTIVITEPGGMSCLMAAGEAWESLPQKTAGIMH